MTNEQLYDVIYELTRKNLILLTALREIADIHRPPECCATVAADAIKEATPC